jgi:hypothetical protein
VRLEIAVQHAATVRVGQGVANANEARQQFAQLQRIGLAPRAATMVDRHGLSERAATDEAHDVKRIGGGRPELVNRRNAGMFELTGDAGFVQEPCRQGRVVRPFRTQLLQCNVPANGMVMGQPDLADAARGV